MNSTGEKFLGYCLDENGTYSAPKVLYGPIEVGDFLLQNVQGCYELRVTDSEDVIVVQVIDQVLRYPLRDGMSPHNRWNPQAKKFVTVQ